MKNIFFWICCLIFSVGFSQSAKPIARHIDQLEADQNSFKSYSLFKTSKLENQSVKTKATDAQVFDQNDAILTQLISEKPASIEVSFPYKNDEITVKLYRKKIFSEGFAAHNEQKEELNYNPGLYYRGIVADAPSSIVAFSFFKHEIIGLASIPEVGNIVVKRLKNAKHYISYNGQTLTSMNPFTCGVDNISQDQQTIEYKPSMTQQSAVTNNCVRIYYEVAYEPYLNNNSSVTQTMDWITAVHNNISTLYENDDIQVALSDVMIWTTSDPYSGTYEENLADFSTNRQGFNGDLAHLVNSPSTTSVAYLNSLCTGAHYAYSGISQYYEEVPTYSWTIQAMTHEMGHSLGSPHTHACAWNGDQTAIDGCGPEAGYGEGCEGPLPESGTIMSYCHLVPTVGINLANGFGEQPSALIRNTINQKPCLGTDCVNSCTATVNDISYTQTGSSSISVTLEDAVSDSWFYKLVPFDAYFDSVDWQTTSSISFDITNLQPNTYYTIAVANQCAIGSQGIIFQELILTDGDYCNGDVFTDTGGTTGNYGNRQHLIKTFYPSNDAENLTMTFNEFNLEDGYDFMSIHDGPSLDSPIFPDGNELTGNLDPISFESTDSTGAITVEFKSDPYSNEQGWEASFTCTSLGLNETNKVNGLTIYPNPAKDKLTIQSKAEMQSIRLFDLAGRLILELNHTNTTKRQLDIDQLSSGVYFMEVRTANHEEVRRIIKE